MILANSSIALQNDLTTRAEKMYLKFVLLGIFEPKADDPRDIKSIRTATELLTGRNWKLVNKEQGNGNILETGENGYFKNGSAQLPEFKSIKTISSNAVSGSDYLFTWQFEQGEKMLDYLFGAVNILKLDEEELILYNDEMDDQGQTSGFINTYRH